MRLSTLVAALMMATACSGAQHGRPGATPDRSEPAFERVLDRISDTGAIDKDTALQAFALAFTPPPGVPRPAGPAEPIMSGTGPLRWVTAHLAELTPPQQQAVKAVARRPAAAAASRADGLVLMASSEQAHLQSLVDEAWAYWSRTIPKSSLLHPTGKAQVQLNPQNVGYNVGGYSNCFDAQGQWLGPADFCVIWFNPALSAGTEDQKREAAYHEVFHCFQDQMLPNLAGMYSFPSTPELPEGPASWLIEGGAAWAAATAMASLSVPTPSGAWFWTRYFHTPTNPLFKRAYDAIGFFAHLQESGTDVLARMPDALRAVVGPGGPGSAFNAFFAGGAGADRFFATWPTSLLRKPSLGPEWDTRGPGITSDAVVPGSVIVDNGSKPAGGQVPAMANDDRLLAVSSDVLVLSARDYSRLRAQAGTLDTSAPSAVYCTKSATCTCPSGSPVAGIAFKSMNRGTYYLALGGGHSGNAWSLAAYSLDQLCQQPAADPCLYGTWRLQGVPPIPLPPQVTIQKLDESLTIGADGVLPLDVDVVDSVHPAGGPSVTAEVTGRITIRALLIGGLIQPLSFDLSGLTAHAAAGPVTVTLPVSQILPNLQGSFTPVAYRCAGDTLTLISQSGTVSTFVKA
jgi:hypothetical protein